MDTYFATADAYSHNLAKLGLAAHESSSTRALCSAPGRASTASTSTGTHWCSRRSAGSSPTSSTCRTCTSSTTRLLAALRGDGTLARRPDRERPPPGASGCARFDLLLTSFPHFVERFRALGVELASTSASASTRGSCERPRRRRRRDTASSSSSARSTALHHRRATASSTRAARRVPIEFWGYDAPRLAALVADPAAATTARRGGSRCTALLRDARIALNRHIGDGRGLREQHAALRGDGRRHAAADRRGPNLAELFEPGREVVTYAGEDDLVEKARHYLAPRGRAPGDRRGGPGADAARAHLRRAGCASWRRSSRSGWRDPPRPAAPLRRQARPDHRRPRLHRLEPRARRSSRWARTSRSSTRSCPEYGGNCSTTSPGSRTG